MLILRDDEAQAVVEAVRALGKAVIRDRVADYRARNEFPHDVHRALADGGLLGGLVPPEWGGAGMSYVTYVEMLEELSTFDHVMAGQAAHASGLLGAGILSFGTDEQRETFLRPLCEGTLHGSVAMTEPDGGSDVATMSTRARVDGDDYVIDGEKTFISHVANAEFFVTFAQSDPERGRKGICAFLVDRHAAGVEILPIDGVEVLRPHSWGQVYFDAVRVPAHRMLGRPGDGLKVALSALEQGRMAIAARACGAARECLAASVHYAKERVVFGRRIADHQMIQARLAEMASDIAASRVLVRHVAALKDAGHADVRAEAAMAKHRATEMLERVASSAISLFGAYGLTKDQPFEQYLLDAKAFQVAEGTTEIQRILIVRDLLDDHKDPLL